MSVLFECSHLTKRYSAAKVAINDLTLSIEPGHIIGLLGPNGSGKTTLIKMINGLLSPSYGTLLIEGNEPGIESKQIISYLPERTYLNNNMRVCDIIDYFQDFYNDFSKENAYKMLSSLGIKAEEKLKTLSKGTKEKVQLILVMSRSAKLYILDEPIAGVDPAARDYILKTIINNYNPEATVLICTHLISEIENILDDVLFLKDGQLVLHKSVDEIREENGKSVDALFREVFAC